MLVETSLAALAAGQQVELRPGDTLRVSVSFKYTVARAATVTLWASLGLGVGRDIESFKEISLDAALTPKTWSGDIDIAIPASGKNNGTYWLRAEIKGYGDTQTTIKDAVVISGMPEGGIPGNTGGLFSMLIVVGIMGMMTGLMKED